MRRTVAFFGPLREAAGRARWTLDLPADARVRDLRRRLESEFGSRALSGAAIADDEGVLPDGALLEGASFSVLPPVAGG